MFAHYIHAFLLIHSSTLLHNAMQKFRTFFRATWYMHVCMYVGDIGTSLLIHTATEQSSASYYGEQGLHYVDVKGESCLVPRGFCILLVVTDLSFSLQSC